MAPASKPYQLLEINIISAQDLERTNKKMRTYAKAWVHPNRKLQSCVDTQGSNNPTWNDKFVFRVNEDFLREDTSAVMIEIYSSHWFKDVIVGTVRVLVGNLFPPPLRSGRGNPHIGMRFIALQVRRPSGRPQGILNIGVALLDGSLRSMPLYRDCSSAVGYRDLMQDPSSYQQDDDESNYNYNVKPILMRSRSERSGMVFDDYSPRSSMVAAPISKVGGKGGSVLSISEYTAPIGKAGGKGGSVLSISEYMETFNELKNKGKGKASSVINGAELREKPKPKGKKGKASSVVSDTTFSKESSFNKKDKIKFAADNDDKNKKVDVKNSPKNKVVGEKVVTNVIERPPLPPPTGKPPKGFLPPPKYKGSSILSISEVGPSPSEVAGMMAQRRYPLEDDGSVLSGWSLDESVEGLRSKLERWRTELPPLYDHGYSSSSFRSSHHTRRNGESTETGLFSCFGNICGYECQIVCGKPPGRKNNNSRYNSSAGSPGESSFL